MKKKIDWPVVLLWAWIIGMVVLLLFGCYVTYQMEVAYYTFHHL